VEFGGTADKSRPFCKDNCGGEPAAAVHGTWDCLLHQEVDSAFQTRK